jgi:hypothetical protein
VLVKCPGECLLGERLCNVGVRLVFVANVVVVVVQSRGDSRVEVAEFPSVFEIELLAVFVTRTL